VGTERFISFSLLSLIIPSRRFSLLPWNTSLKRILIKYDKIFFLHFEKIKKCCFSYRKINYFKWLHVKISGFHDGDYEECRPVVLVRTYVSEEPRASIIRVAIVGELGTALRSSLLITANVVPSPPILVTLMLEVLNSPQNISSYKSHKA
jgi:hypothetical protein